MYAILRVATLSKEHKFKLLSQISEFMDGLDCIGSFNGAKEL